MIMHITHILKQPESVVGFVTCCELGCLESLKPSGVWDVPEPSRLAQGLPSLLYNGLPGLFPGGKVARAWCWPVTLF